MTTNQKIITLRPSPSQAEDTTKTQAAFRRTGIYPTIRQEAPSEAHTTTIRAEALPPLPRRSRYACPTSQQTGRVHQRNRLTRGLGSRIEEVLHEAAIGAGRGEEFQRFGPPLNIHELLPVRLSSTFLFFTGPQLDGTHVHHVSHPIRVAYIDDAQESFFLQVKDDRENHWFGPIPMEQTQQYKKAL